MPKLIMTKGLPASGKSTWAKEVVSNGKNKWKRVNKDDLRSMVDDGKHNSSREKHIILAEEALVNAYLAAGLNVIVDNTHLNPVHEDRLRKIAETWNAEFEINDSFLQVPLEECIQRDRNRENPVGDAVILDMHMRYLRPKVIWNTKRPSCIICDLDGTIAQTPNGNWYDRDYSKDIVIPQTLEVLKGVYDYVNRIIFLSGRSEKGREGSEQFIKETTSWWLYDNWELHMRTDGDNRPDWIVKKELYDQHVLGKYNVRYVFDDRPQVVRLWRSLGLFVFDVNQRGGEF